MSLIFNGTTVTEVIYNGVNLDSMYYNGVEVFTSKFNYFDIKYDPLDIYTFTQGSEIDCTQSRDSLTDPSPAGGIPLKMTITGNGQYFSTFNNALYNIARASDGETWKVSTLVKASENTIGAILILGADSTGSVALDNGSYSFGEISIGTDWTEVSFEFTFNYPSVEYIQCILHGAQFDGFDEIDVWFDNLKVTKTSTPSDPSGLSVPLLTLSGENDAWTERTIDLSAYAGRTVRIIWKYVSSTYDAGDLQIDGIEIDGTMYDTPSGSDFQTSISQETSYGGVSWYDMVSDTTAGRWNSNSGDTPSSNTGRSDNLEGSVYYYAETSGYGTGFPNKHFWLRSFSFTCDEDSYVSFYEARKGESIGTLEVMVDVIT